MILKLKECCEFIEDWIKQHAFNCGINKLVINLDGNINSLLAALIAGRTGLELTCFHFTPNKKSEIINDFIKVFGFNLVEINLSQSCHDLIGQLSLAQSNLENEDLNLALRSAVLSYFAKSSNSLVVGTSDRTMYNLVRNHLKIDNGAIDIYPIADLHRSETKQLFQYLTSSDALINSMVESSQLIYQKSISISNEIYSGISFEEIEWIDKEDIKNNIVSSENSPINHYEWTRYQGRQKEIIAQLHQIEKITRNKHNNNLPVCKIRKENFIR